MHATMLDVAQLDTQNDQTTETWNTIHPPPPSSSQQAAQWILGEAQHCFNGTTSGRRTAQRLAKSATSHRRSMEQTQSMQRAANTCVTYEPAASCIEHDGMTDGPIWKISLELW